MNAIGRGGFELRTEDGSHFSQPTPGQLAQAIMALAAPGNRFVSIAPVPHGDWYAEVTLPQPDANCIFEGPYEIHFQDDQADEPKHSVFGDDPQAMAVRILIWVQSMIKSRR